jgi:uncharacterized surface protein with fasciclin (FAS1) repeats
MFTKWNRLSRLGWFVAPACVALVGAGVVSTISSQRAVAADSMMPMEKHDIIDTATGPGMEQVTTVVTAIKAAGLVDALKGEGPFTVFAPTNAAFDKLPKGTVEDLLKHKGDAIAAKDVKTMDLSTLNGKALKVVLDGDKVMINDAKVVKADVQCTNGTIHWIDTVLMP